MEVVVSESASAASALAARVVAALVARKPRAVLGLATGSTPLLLYRELARLHRDERLDFSGASAFALDEYLGIAPEHPASCRRFLKEQLLSLVNLPPRRFHAPDGQASDVPASCAAYETAIAEAGGIDLQVLGLGVDAHIAFNEPGSSLASRTRIKTLARETLERNAPLFGGAGVPKHVVTMGIGTILESRTCLLLAFGGDKAEAVARVVEGPVTAAAPGSALQLHADTRVFLDAAAASRLARADYYRFTWENKPEWQRD